MPQNQKNQSIAFHVFKQLAILVILYNIIHTNYKVYKKYSLLNKKNALHKCKAFFKISVLNYSFGSFILKVSIKAVV